MVDGLAQAEQGSLPQLESGDRLDRDEFERRYWAMPPDTRAELIGGVVYVASPVRISHSSPQTDLALWLRTFAVSTPHTQALVDATVRLAEEDEPQPDALLRILPAAGGGTHDEDDYVRGPPELVAEVALSSAAYDLHQKLEAYRREGCREYVVIVVHSREVRWFRLQGSEFVPQEPDADGIFRSRVFPGLWLDGPALVRGDASRVLEVLQQGLATEEHAAFVRELEVRFRGTG